MEWLKTLSGETIASAIAGIVVAGAMLRSAIKGYVEGRQQASSLGTNAAAMMSAVAIGFEKVQRDQLCTDIGRIASALEQSNKHMADISDAQAAQADRRSIDMDGKLDELLERVDRAEREQRLAPLPRRPGGR